MLPISRSQCGDLLAMWLEKSSGMDAVKQLVKDTGYNDSPLFGAEKKKIKIVGELVMANTALAIFAVNQVFKTHDAKAIIDALLAVGRKTVFGMLESKDSDFKKRYEQRMGEYSQILSAEQPALGMSFSFMKNLDLDPRKNLQGQILVAKRLDESLSSTLDVLKTFKLQSSDDSVQPLIPDVLFYDDRMFVLEICPVESRDATSTVLDISGGETQGRSLRTPSTKEWAVVTRRNVPGYPPHRVDPFPTKAEAVAFYKRIVVQSPRKSLGEKSPDPLPTIEAYTAWLAEQNLYDPILNPRASRQTDV